MSIIKLKEAGESHTMTVTACESVKGQYGEQMKFDGDGDTIYLPQDSAERQLTRLGLDAETVVGEHLTFSRSPNPKKGAAPFWDIAPAKAGTPAPSRRIAPPSGAPPQGVSRGSLPFDEPTAEERAMVGHSAPPDAPLMGDEPELTPRELAALDARSQRERDYLACWDRVAAHLRKTCQTHNIPLDASAVQATTFSIFGGAR